LRENDIVNAHSVKPGARDQTAQYNRTQFASRYRGQSAQKLAHRRAKRRDDGGAA
jgi:hypothetical protein